MLDTNAERPKWVDHVDFLVLESLRVHYQVELDLRGVLRSEGDPDDTLTRARRILSEGVAATSEILLTARMLLLVNRATVDRDAARSVAERIAAVQMLVLARVSGSVCADYFHHRKDVDALDLVRNVCGMVPLFVDLEGQTASLFDASPTGIHTS